MTRTAFTTILVANRGEIACRVLRTARAEGYRTVAVYSEADAGALHVRQADQALCIGPPPVRESYLSIEAVLRAAAASGAEAIHPGYGFLSENAAFARAVQAAGLVFIGPDPHAIEQMGNKAAAKRLMLAAGVPCVPGYQGPDQSDAALLAHARDIGLPIMVKAAAGGGGRGMRQVADMADLPAALATARSEAASAFGSDELILERALVEPRHVEVQVFADRHGNVIHLGERDCSIQRRHQKVFEEAPSPAVDASLRDRMGAAAVAAARAVQYVGAGTVEFLLDPEGRFYFLEMNTRLQVEHPVTECITGQDLVAWQLAVARGQPLPLAQDQVRWQGHAFEARLYAEDPQADFLPQSGSVALWRAPAGAGVRVDHGVASGQDVSPYYDPMIAKIITHGATRDEARRRLLGALRATRVLGLPTNLAFLTAAAEHDEFAGGAATTAFIGRHFGPEQLQARAPSSRVVAVAAALCFDASAYRGPQAAWRSSGVARWPMDLSDGKHAYPVHVTVRGAGRLHVGLDGGSGHDIELGSTDHGGGAERLLSVDGLCTRVTAVIDGPRLHLAFDGATASFEDVTYAPPRGSEEAAESTVNAPMSGRVLAVLVQEGDRVAKGQRLAVLEAMKMEHQLVARRDGLIERISVRAGDQVAARAVIVTLQAAVST